jgi:esterase/lipase superfamily enzyme
MHREHSELVAPGLDRAGVLIRYGHYGRPVLALPDERGEAEDYAANGMVDAVAASIEAGRAQLYCVNAFDRESWSARMLSLEERARQHEHVESWVTEHVVPRIAADSPGSGDVVLTGCGRGAFGALNLVLRRPDLFPVAICQSGHYEPTEWSAWGEPGATVYAHSPVRYVPDLDEPYVARLRGRVFVVLTAGRGEGEVLDSTRRMARALEARGIPHEVDEWGLDPEPGWEVWAGRLARHLPRFC